MDAEVKGRIAGVAASEGIAVGPFFVHTRGELKPERENISEDAVEEELGRCQSAVEAVVRRLSERRRTGCGRTAARGRPGSLKRTSRWRRTPNIILRPKSA